MFTCKQVSEARCLKALCLNLVSSGSLAVRRDRSSMFMTIRAEGSKAMSAESQQACTASNFLSKCQLCLPP